MVIIGLTGGVCSGKSTVSRILQSYGANIIDADKLGHEAYLPNTNCYNNLISEFGDSIISDDETKTINRQILRSIVFSNKEKMKILQGIVWPEIRLLAQNKINEIKLDQLKSCNHIVFEAAVMIEAGWLDLVDKVWVVEISREIALERLQNRNKLSYDEALKIVESQLSNEDRRQYASSIIINNGDLVYLETQCKELWNIL